jgi:hypothetical protein
MGGSSSSEKEAGEHSESNAEMTTKKTVCTTISGGKHNKRTLHKRIHPKRNHSKRTHKRR